MIYCLEDTYYDILASRGMLANDIEEVYDCLDNIDYRVRTLAAQVIQVNYCSEKSFNKAVDMLNSEEFTQREIGAYILGQLGTPTMPFAKKSLTLLYNLFNDKNDEVLVAVISAIGHLWSYTDIVPKEDIVDEIINFTKHKNSDIKIASVMTLSALECTNKIINVINILLKDSDSEVKEWTEVAEEILVDKNT